MERIERLDRLFPLLLSRLGRLRTLVHDGMDLTYNQYKTLLTIAGRPQCSLRDLARELEVAMSSASEMVDRLVGQGLIDRAQDAEDRRQLLLRLTPQGKALIGDLQRGILRGYDRLLRHLPEEEQEELVRAFETIARILEKLT